MIALTDDGRAVLTACRTAIRTMEAEFLAAVPEAERHTFVEVLNQLTEQLRSPKKQ